MTLLSLDLFSCIGAHAIGFARAGIETVAFCESRPERRADIAKRFPGVAIYDDVREVGFDVLFTDIVIGGPPCQRTSVASAIHNYRTGESLWPYMLFAGLCASAEWAVVCKVHNRHASGDYVSCKPYARAGSLLALWRNWSNSLPKRVK